MTTVYNPVSPGEHDRIVKMALAGADIKHICRFLHRSHKTIKSILVKENLFRSVPLDQMLTVPQIGAKLGISKSTANLLLRRLNISPDYKGQYSRTYYNPDIIDRLKKTEEYQTVLASVKHRAAVSKKNRDLRLLPYQRKMLCAKCFYLTDRNVCRRCNLPVYDLDRRSKICGCYKFEPKDNPTRLEIQQVLTASLNSEVYDVED